jgi:hypothetical protein
MTEHDEIDEDDDLSDREPYQIRLSVSQDWIEDTLMPAYPHVTTVSQAARSALADGVEAQQEASEPGIEASIGRDVIEALQRLGGEVENCQSVTINAPEHVEIGDAEAVVDESE